MKIFGYCRVSTIKQKLERQEQNIKEVYPEAILFREEFSGRTLDRPQYILLRQIASKGDKIVFDSVSRMSRNAEEGYQEYMTFWENGITLEFLNEPHLNTDFFTRQLKSMEFNVDVDKTFEPLIEGIKKTLQNIIKGQIKIGFEQSEKEVNDLSKRTKEALAVLKEKGKELGRPKRRIPETIKKDIIENYILSRKKKGKDFMEVYKISKPTFYIWLREIKGEMGNDNQY